MQRSMADDVRLPAGEQPVAAVKILDAEGRVLRIVPASEFQQNAARAGRTERGWRRGRKPAA